MRKKLILIYFCKGDFQEFLKGEKRPILEEIKLRKKDSEIIKPVDNKNAMPNPTEPISLQNKNQVEKFSSENELKKQYSNPPSITIIGDFQRAGSFGTLHKEYHIRVKF